MHATLSPEHQSIDPSQDAHLADARDPCLRAAINHAAQAAPCQLAPCAVAQLNRIPFALRPAVRLPAHSSAEHCTVFKVHVDVLPRYNELAQSVVASREEDPFAETVGQASADRHCVIASIPTSSPIAHVARLQTLGRCTDRNIIDANATQANLSRTARMLPRLATDCTEHV
jgi:hypothetical protein